MKWVDLCFCFHYREYANWMRTTDNSIYLEQFRLFNSIDIKIRSEIRLSSPVFVLPQRKEIETHWMTSLLSTFSVRRWQQQQQFLYREQYIIIGVSLAVASNRLELHNGTSFAGCTRASSTTNCSLFINRDKHYASIFLITMESKSNRMKWKRKLHARGSLQLHWHTSYWLQRIQSIIT